MIIVRLQGGLGNQMFQYAFAKSMALKLNTQFMLDCRFLLDRTPKPNFTFREYDLSIFNLETSFYKPSYTLTPYKIYSDKFFSTLIKKIQKKIPNFYRNFYIEPHFHFDDKYCNGAKQKYCLGYFQSYKYFETIDNIIRSDFSFKYPIDENCLWLLNKIQSSNSVCVHVRRGDYINSSYYTSTSQNYYKNALEKLLCCEKNIEIFLFSDDVEWCRNNINFDVHTTFVSEKYAGNKAKNHFELMQNCKHFIISNSSFAWWAAYLSSNNQKKVFAPKNWFQDKSIITKDLFPDNWFVI